MASAAHIHELSEKLPYGEVFLPPSRDYQRAISIDHFPSLVPSAVVLPRSTKDVVQIVDFAREKKVDLTVKNGGHSFAGYCLNNGGIVIDLSAMNNARINKEGTEVTIQAGCTWKDVYAVLDPGDIVVGGLCPAVGVSGFTLAGGCSPFSRSYGLGIDNVLEMTIVTAAGKVVTVRREDISPQKKDLFWALRGGGGGNFGILLEFKSRCSPDEEAQKVFLDMVDTFNAHEWPDELTVWAAWYYDTNKGLLGRMAVYYNGNMRQCLQVVAPLLKHKLDKSLSGLQEMTWRNWVERQNNSNPSGNMQYRRYVSFILKSIPRGLAKTIIKTMEESKKLLANDGGYARFMWAHVGGATAGVGSSDTPFPWRDGLYITRLTVRWNSQSMEKKVNDFINDYKKQLSPFALKEKAAFLNFVDGRLDNWTEAYYDTNYPRLQTVKARWDPDNFFKFPKSIQLPTSHHIASIARAFDSRASLQLHQPLPNLTVPWNLTQSSNFGYRASRSRKQPISHYHALSIPLMLVYRDFGTG
ncbi:uncharacterized protein EI90DRAFT_3287957 [Cantharellus anzutake]|uniref:uncharacterized protein n=1 Tax=Cantharellus anzutake TaxID=1750568 RepID=UPI0019036F15|nr:uncharacterized protein EI90DRAFT_3287957 [Cantharellus anzutake]KAF8335464.1 hypothetical protein EI90DRAFT_3287957 [Cantharellus anzutake]